MLMLSSDTRRWNATPLAWDTSMKACADEADSELRIMTPALTQFASSEIVATRATIVPSPESGW